jgi:chromosomal replication initiator protein
MIAANDSPAAVMQLHETDDVQLRLLIAHAAGLLAHRSGIGPARSTLYNIINALPGSEPTMASIAADVAGKYGISIDALRSRDQTHDIAHPRQEAMYLMHKTGRYSMPQIGRYFGGKDHTTVLHGIRAHAKRAGL